MGVTSALGLATRVVRVATVHERRVGGKVFLVMPDGTMHVLDNQTAVVAWDRIGEVGGSGATVGDLVTALVASFQVTPENAATDARSFVQGLLTAGALAVDSPTCD